MTIQARELGRNLILDLGDDTEITIRPISGKLGAALYALWAGIAFAQSEQVEADAEAMGRLAVGEENWPLIDGELRWAEAEKVIHAAFFWNVQSGGIDLVRLMLEDGGYPKAVEALTARNGHSRAFALLKTLLSSDEASVTPALADSSGTSTPLGSVS